MYQVGIIIQARNGSTRLPGKMSTPFYQEQTLLEVILRKLDPLKKERKVILATTTNPSDDSLADMAQELGFDVFRGDENKVLKRFIEAAETFQLTGLVRICADNPFIQPNLISELITSFNPSETDYKSWLINEKRPSIKTHSGFFAEAISLSALKQTERKTTDSFYLEHVTNYIYGNPEHFKIEWIPFNEPFLDKIRLTIDTIHDFQVSSFLYSELYPKIDIENILSYLKISSGITDKMSVQIQANEK
jgi:spore coat polysaccharide biosynthesis protein SpsF (cytidylyltransferase family)